MLDFCQYIFSQLVAGMSSVLFYNIGGFPFIVLWLVVAAVFFTIYLRGVNFRLFRHALQIVSGKYDNHDATGEVSHMQALFSAIAATVGLGSIAGVSVAVAVGGPGVVFWIVIAGFFGMATKFAEVMLSMCYREHDENGKIFGGPFQYIKKGLADIGLPRAGKVLAVIFAIFCLGGALGGGNMFQSNQTVKVMITTFPGLAGYGWAIALAFGWSYYGEIAWSYMFGSRYIRLYQLIFCLATFLGGIMQFGVVLDFSDLLILGMALPNITALYLLRKRVRSEMLNYMEKL